MKMKAEEKRFLENIVAIVDNREGDPLDLLAYGLRVKIEGLKFGDYSLHYPDMRKYLTIERKTLDDLVQCVGRNRIRFERELITLRGFKYRMVIIEGSYQDIVEENYKGRMSSEAIRHSIAKWTTWNIPFMFVENHENAEEYVAYYLKKVALEMFKFCKKDLSI